MTRIAVDAMGGDYGPSVVVPAALMALATHEKLHLTLVGDQVIVHNELKKARSIGYPTRLDIRHASQSVEMNESPAAALRTKKDSSMRVAINLVKEGVVDACVSAGNTGALMATAHFVLKTLPGVDRPAIVSTFPTTAGKKNVRMLDLGADVDSTAENLLQFAVMGSVLVSALEGIQNPKVCLLNIGKEDIKGNEQVKKTAELLSKTSLINYAGYIEGDQIYAGDADVVVCDGFVGNIALKTTEGVARFIRQLFTEAFKRTWLTRIVGLIAMPILKSVGKRIDPNRYNGASLLGLKGIVIKSHGGAKIAAFARAIEEAMIEAEKNIPQLIGNEVERLLTSSANLIKPSHE